MKLPISIFFFILCLTAAIGGKESETRGDDLKVAILGTGAKEDEPELIDLQLLAKLLKQIREHKPSLVIFTGDLIQGFGQSTSSESLNSFREYLRTFSQIVTTHLGKQIPFYPILGNHTFVNSEAINIFKSHFHIENIAPLEPYQLGYSLRKANANFTFLASGLFQRKFQRYSFYSNYMPILDWVEKNVKTDGDVDFRFVIGHDPIFSINYGGGFLNSEDGKLTPNKEDFWKILQNNKVSGYFCSRELIYDRSNRRGVWQVISGGIGDPKKFPNEEDMFKHFVLLLIPKDKKKAPTVEAIDVHGKVWDKFELLHVDRPVHHFTISGN